MGKGRLKSMSEALECIPEGASIALGTGESSGVSAAFLAEIVRQDRRDLRLIGPGGGQLANLVACAWGLPFGNAGSHEATVVRMGLSAAAMGLPGLPMPAQTAEDDRAGDIRGMVAALVPDYAVIHAHAADASGRVLLRAGNRYKAPFDQTVARAARNVIVTVEQVVAPQTVAAFAEDLLLDADEVSAVVEAPFGAWPLACAGRYEEDMEVSASLARAIRNGKAASSAWLDAYVRRHAGHAAMIDALGSQRLLEGGVRRAW